MIAEATIYELALRFADQYELNSVIDLGCRNVELLTPFFERGMWLIGVGDEASVASFKQSFADSVGMKCNLKNAIPYIDKRYLRKAIVMCANVDEVNVLGGMVNYLQTAPFGIVGTFQDSKVFLTTLKEAGLKPLSYQHNQDGQFSVMLKGVG